MPIRTPTAEDLPAVTGLLRAAGLMTEDVADRLGEYLVDEEARRLRAVAGLERHARTALLRSVAVAPAARGAGVARRLCAHLLDAAAADGLDDVYLLTEGADAWFERLGFERMPRERAPAAIRASRQFAALCPASAVLMRLDLRRAPARILVLNPNSTAAVTTALDASLAPLRGAGGPAIECETLACGPPGIESDADVETVAPAVAAWVESRERAAAAFVVACFSDPGVAAARRRVRVPVLGMAECGYRAAAARGRFGVISILEPSVARHRGHIEALGLIESLAGDLPLGLGVRELADEASTFARLVETGTALRDAHGAESLVLGCAGMAAYADRLEATLGVRVIEPVRAAVREAMGAVAGQRGAA